MALNTNDIVAIKKAEIDILMLRVWRIGKNKFLKIFKQPRFAIQRKKI